MSDFDVTVCMHISHLGQRVLIINCRVEPFVFVNIPQNCRYFKTFYSALTADCLDVLDNIDSVCGVTLGHRARGS